jgi:hypothetical protein
MISSVLTDQHCIKSENRRSCISFNKEVFARPHLHLNDFSEDEIDLYWYSHDETVTLFEADCSHTTKMMIAGKCYEGDTVYCARGLECSTPAGTEVRLQNKINAWDAVLEEQDRQWCAGVFDTESLARVYSACSIQCTRNAHLMATNDEIIAHDQGRKSALKAEGIEGYPLEEQKAKLIQTAIKVFTNEKPETMQNATRILNDDLESVKSTHSLRSKQNGIDGSDYSQSTIASQDSNREGSMMRRVVSLGGLVMRKRSSEKLRSSKNFRSSRNLFLSNPISETNATFVDNSIRKNETFNPKINEPNNVVFERNPSHRNIIWNVNGQQPPGRILHSFSTAT